MWRVLVLAILVLLEAAPAVSADAGPRTGGTYRYPLRYSPRTLDPAKSSDIYAITVIQQLFDGLVDVDQDLNLIPAIARSWRVSRDGRVYTFELRKGVRFHNGREVTAEDVVYSLTRLLHPKTQSPAASQFQMIVGAEELLAGRVKILQGVRIIDPGHVEIRLKEPYTPFLSLLAMMAAKIVPREVVEARDLSFDRAPVGTGPFRLVRWDEGREIILEANLEYFRGRPYLDRIVYTIRPSAADPKLQYQEFRAGAFEEGPIPGDLREEVLSDKAIQVVRRPILAVQFYAFNLNRPEWRDRRIREALLVALDRTAIVHKAFRDQYKPAAGILPPGLPGYKPNREIPRADIPRATSLFRQAGGAGNVKLVELWSAVNTPTARVELEAARDAWGLLGIPVQIRYAADWPEFQSLMRAGQMSIFRRAWYADLPDPDNVLAVLFHSKSAYNYMRYVNKDVDRLLDQGRVEQDPVRRAELYREAEDRILADVPVIPIMYMSFERAFQPYVRGIEVSALGAPYIPMRKVWLDRQS